LHCLDIRIWHSYSLDVYSLFKGKGISHYTKISNLACLPELKYQPSETFLRCYLRSDWPINISVFLIQVHPGRIHCPNPTREPGLVNKLVDLLYWFQDGSSIKLVIPRLASGSPKQGKQKSHTCHITERLNHWSIFAPHPVVMCCCRIRCYTGIILLAMVCLHVYFFVSDPI
jgi:hypothetical protein